MDTGLDCRQGRAPSPPPLLFDREKETLLTTAAVGDIVCSTSSKIVYTGVKRKSM